jgi:hypothetical protein
MMRTSGGDSRHQLRVSSTSGPVFVFSPARYRVAVVAGLVASGTLIASGNTVAIAGIALTVLFALSVRERLVHSGVALARDHGQLVGQALPRPLRADGTTFALEDDYNGGWLIVLTTADGARTRLSPGGWRLETQGSVTRDRAAQALSDMGLTRHD